MYSTRRLYIRRSSEEREKQPRGKHYLETALGALFVVLLFEWIWPDVIPFTLFEFWHLKGSLWGALIASWPLFVWGIVVTSLAAYLTQNSAERNQNAEAILGEGFARSLFAGVMEEISFRWLIFFNEIVAYKIFNWLIFGWAGFGIFEWFYLHVTGPLANIVTFGFLEPYLFNGFGWFVGAALLTSNGKFRNGHAYQGLLGLVNSWYIGLFMFYLMFQYGLLAAILVHFLYDMFIFVVAYIDAAIERSRGL